MDTRAHPSPFVLVASIALAGALLGAIAGCQSSGVVPSRAAATVTPGAIGSVSSEEALQRLVEGNARFVANKDNDTPRDPARRGELAKGQHPFAVVLTCSDSRLPPELIFDQELGDLFVVRVAGNTADDVALGSMEYAVEHLGAQLIVVMGHEKCGAVAAAVAAETKGEVLPGHLPAVVADIRPVVKQGALDGGDVVHNCVWHNAANVANRIRSTGPVFTEFLHQGRLRVTAAVYDLETGVVRFLPQLPPESDTHSHRPAPSVAHGEHEEHEEPRVPAGHDDHH